MLNCMDLTRYRHTVLNQGLIRTSLVRLAMKHLAFGKDSTRTFE